MTKGVAIKTYLKLVKEERKGEHPLLVDVCDRLLYPQDFLFELRIQAGWSRWLKGGVAYRGYSYDFFIVRDVKYLPQRGLVLERTGHPATA